MADPQCGRRCWRQAEIAAVFAGHCAATRCGRRAVLSMARPCRRKPAADLFDVIQVTYSVFDQRLADQVLPLAQRRNVGVMARSVLLKGALTARADHFAGAVGTIARPLTPLPPTGGGGRLGRDAGTGRHCFRLGPAPDQQCPGRHP
ncbi:MAG: hypothetical protein R2867_13350 [Caldilineaceae bacterium]